MGSRDQILKALRAGRGDTAYLEEAPAPQVTAQDRIARFQSMLESIGGCPAVIGGQDALNHFLQQERDRHTILVNGIKGTDGYNLEFLQQAAARDLEAVHTAVIRGSLGVAENGAVWVRERDMGHRILPFICQQLVLVLEERAIVATMHEAYEQLRIAEEGYGVFIAGPSKTADIEQSLVIGAHGPVEMRVLIINE